MKKTIVRRRCLTALLLAALLITGLLPARKADAADLTSRVMNVPWIHQGIGLWDPKTNSFTHTDWPNLKFENSTQTMRSSGCGFACAAGAISYLLGRTVNPQEIMTYACGFNGTAGERDLGVRSARKYGLQAETVSSPTKKQIADTLLAGNPVMVLEQRSKFGSGGAHYILLIGYRNGRFAVLDPNGVRNSWYCDQTTQTWEDIDQGAWRVPGAAGEYTIFHAPQSGAAGKSGGASADHTQKAGKSGQSGQAASQKKLTGFQYLADQKITCYYNKNGVKLYGQQKIAGYWYYFQPKTGAMKRGFQYLSDQKKTVYYDKNGRMLYGQQKIGGRWYYFQPKTGAMKRGFQYLSNQKKTVYYDKNGRMLYGQQKINGKWYLFDGRSGAMKYGFQRIADQHKTCYYNSRGQMVYGRQRINGRWYTFHRVTGALLTR